MPHLSDEVVAGSKFRSDIFGAELQCIYYPDLVTYLTDAGTLTDLNISPKS